MFEFAGYDTLESPSVCHHRRKLYFFYTSMMNLINESVKNYLYLIYTLFVKYFK